MKAALALGALVTCLATPAPAAASSCGGGADGGSSSGDSGGDGGGGDATPACVDAVDIHGYRRCTRFGAWANNLRLPRVFVQLGTAVRSAPTLAAGRTGHVEHDGETFQFRTLTPPAGGLGVDHALVTTARLGIGLPRGAYVAVEAEVGVLARPSAAAPQMTTSGLLGTPSIDERRGVVVNAAGVVGLGAHLATSLVGVELAGGIRSTHYTYDSQYLACEATSMISASAPLAEVRARAEHWLGPFVTLGATVGASLIERGAWMGGIHVGFHTRAYAGGR